MKILFCTNNFERVTNGPAKFANLLWEMPFHHPDVEVRILTEDISEVKERVYKLDVSYPSAFSYLGQIIRVFLYAKKIKQVLKEYPADVLVFNHSFHGLATSYQTTLPIIGMINDDNSCSKSISNIKLNKVWLSYYIYGLLEKWSIKRFSSTLVNSIFLFSQLINDYKLNASNASKLRLFYKAIKVPSSLSPSRPFGETIKILFVKADFERGGLFTLIKALERLKQFNFECTIIGPEDRFHEKIRSFYKDVNNVKFKLLGYRDTDYVKSSMYSNDIFCVPSLQEALGVANLEALTRGISVVSSNVGGIPEIMDHGQNGWIVPPGDEIALSLALMNCIEDSDLREQKRLSGWTFAQKFDVQYLYSNFKELVSEQLG